jgi:hypothetical protein
LHEVEQIDVGSGSAANSYNDDSGERVKDRLDKFEVCGTNEFKNNVDGSQVSNVVQRYCLVGA